MSKIREIIAIITVLAIAIYIAAFQIERQRAFNKAITKSDTWQEAYFRLRASKIYTDTTWVKKEVPVQRVDSIQVIDSVKITDTVLSKKLENDNYLRTYADTIKYPDLDLFYNFKVAGFLTSPPSFGYKAKFPVITKGTLIEPVTETPKPKVFSMGVEAGWQQDAYVGAFAEIKSKWGIRYNYNLTYKHGVGITCKLF